MRRVLLNKWWMLVIGVMMSMGMVGSAWALATDGGSANVNDANIVADITTVMAYTTYTAQIGGLRTVVSNVNRASGFFPAGSTQDAFIPAIDQLFKNRNYSDSTSIINLSSLFISSEGKFKPSASPTNQSLFDNDSSIMWLESNIFQLSQTTDYSTMVSILTGILEAAAVYSNVNQTVPAQIQAILGTNLKTVFGKRATTDTTGQTTLVIGTDPTYPLYAQLQDALSYAQTTPLLTNADQTTATNFSNVLSVEINLLTAAQTTGAAAQISALVKVLFTPAATAPFSTTNPPTMANVLAITGLDLTITQNICFSILSKIFNTRPNGATGNPAFDFNGLQNIQAFLNTCAKATPSFLTTTQVGTVNGWVNTITTELNNFFAAINGPATNSATITSPYVPAGQTRLNMVSSILTLMTTPAPGQTAVFAKSQGMQDLVFNVLARAYLTRATTNNAELTALQTSFTAWQNNNFFQLVTPSAGGGVGPTISDTPIATAATFGYTQAAKTLFPTATTYKTLLAAMLAQVNTDVFNSSITDPTVDIYTIDPTNPIFKDDSRRIIFAKLYYAYAQRDKTGKVTSGPTNLQNVMALLSKWVASPYPLNCTLAGNPVAGTITVPLAPAGVTPFTVPPGAKNTFYTDTVNSWITQVNADIFNSSIADPSVDINTIDPTNPNINDDSRRIIFAKLYDAFSARAQLGLQNVLTLLTKWVSAPYPLNCTQAGNPAAGIITTPAGATLTVPVGAKNTYYTDTVNTWIKQINTDVFNNNLQTADINTINPNDPNINNDSRRIIFAKLYDAYAARAQLGLQNVLALLNKWTNNGQPTPVPLRPLDCTPNTYSPAAGTITTPAGATLAVPAGATYTYYTDTVNSWIKQTNSDSFNNNLPTVDINTINPNDPNINDDSRRIIFAKLYDAFVGRNSSDKTSLTNLLALLNKWYPPATPRPLDCTIAGNPAAGTITTPGGNTFTVPAGASATFYSDQVKSWIQLVTYELALLDPTKAPPVGPNGPLDPSNFTQPIPPDVQASIFNQLKALFDNRNTATANMTIANKIAYLTNLQTLFIQWLNSGKLNNPDHSADLTSWINTLAAEIKALQFQQTLPPPGGQTPNPPGPDVVLSDDVIAATFAALQAEYNNRAKPTPDANRLTALKTKLQAWIDSGKLIPTTPPAAGTITTPNGSFTVPAGATVTYYNDQLAAWIAQINKELAFLQVFPGGVIPAVITPDILDKLDPSMITDDATRAKIFAAIMAMYKARTSTDINSLNTIQTVLQKWSGVSPASQGLTCNAVPTPPANIELPKFTGAVTLTYYNDQMGVWLSTVTIEQRINNAMALANYGPSAGTPDRLDTMSQILTDVANQMAGVVFGTTTQNLFAISLEKLFTDRQGKQVQLIDLQSLLAVLQQTPTTPLLSDTKPANYPYTQRQVAAMMLQLVPFEIALNTALALWQPGGDYGAMMDSLLDMLFKYNDPKMLPALFLAATQNKFFDAIQMVVAGRAGEYDAGASHDPNIHGLVTFLVGSSEDATVLLNDNQKKIAAIYRDMVNTELYLLGGVRSYDPVTQQTKAALALQEAADDSFDDTTFKYFANFWYSFYKDAAGNILITLANKGNYTGQIAVLKLAAISPMVGFAQQQEIASFLQSINEPVAVSATAQQIATTIATASSSTIPFDATTAGLLQISKTTTAANITPDAQAAFSAAVQQVINQAQQDPTKQAALAQFLTSVQQSPLLTQDQRNIISTVVLPTVQPAGPTPTPITPTPGPAAPVTPIAPTAKNINASQTLSDQKQVDRLTQIVAGAAAGQPVSQAASTAFNTVVTQLMNKTLSPSVAGQLAQVIQSAQGTPLVSQLTQSQQNALSNGATKLSTATGTGGGGPVATTPAATAKGVKNAIAQATSPASQADQLKQLIDTATGTPDSNAQKEFTKTVTNLINLAAAGDTSALSNLQALLTDPNVSAWITPDQAAAINAAAQSLAAGQTPTKIGPAAPPPPAKPGTITQDLTKLGNKKLSFQDQLRALQALLDQAGNLTAQQQTEYNTKLANLVDSLAAAGNVDALNQLAALLPADQQTALGLSNKIAAATTQATDITTTLDTKLSILASTSSFADKLRKLQELLKWAENKTFSADDQNNFNTALTDVFGAPDASDPTYKNDLIKIAQAAEKSDLLATKDTATQMLHDLGAKPTKPVPPARPKGLPQRGGAKKSVKPSGRPSGRPTPAPSTGGITYPTGTTTASDLQSQQDAISLATDPQAKTHLIEQMFVWGKTKGVTREMIDVLGSNIDSVNRSDATAVAAFNKLINQLEASKDLTAVEAKRLRTKLSKPAPTGTTLPTRGK